MVILKHYRDDTPHVPNEDLGEEKVINIIGNLTQIITEVFPRKTSLGAYIKKNKKLTPVSTHLI